MALGGTALAVFEVDLAALAAVVVDTELTVIVPSAAHSAFSVMNRRQSRSRTMPGEIVTVLVICPALV